MRTIRFRRLALLTLCFAAAALTLGCTVRTTTRPATTSPPPARYETVTVDSLNVRSGPGTRNGVVEVVHYGSRVEIYSRDGNWINIRTPLNQTGWVYGAYLTGFPDIHRPSGHATTSGGVESEEFIPGENIDVPPPPSNPPSNNQEPNRGQAPGGSI